MSTILVERATPDDSERILDLQKIAYVSEARIYDDYSIHPLVQTLDEIRSEFNSHVFLKAVQDAELHGTVRANQEGTTCYVGKLAVRPDMQNRGIGQMLMREIELQFPSASRFELFTGHLSKKSLYLYGKLGYRIFKEQQMNPKLTLLYLEKF